MRKIPKYLLVIAVIAMVLSVFAGCKKDPVVNNSTEPTSEVTASAEGEATPDVGNDDERTIDPNKSELKINMFGYGKPNPVFDPVDTSLKEYVQQKAQEYVGRKVTFKYVTSTEQDVSYAQYLELQIAANTYPDLIGAADLFWLAADYAAIRDTDRTRDMTIDMVKENMPGYMARMQEYGIDPDTFLSNNKDTATGRMPYIPMGVPIAVMENLPVNFTPLKGANPDTVWKNGSTFYNWMMRDDVMKAIWGDSVKSEKDLMEIYANNGGSLEVSDIIDDFGWDGSLASIKEYMTAVKEKDMKNSAGKTIMPGMLVSDSERATSISWSLATLTGYCYRWPLRFHDDPAKDGGFFITTHPNYKEYLAWWNDIYLSGLLDPELFVMKNDQMRSKVANGEYAIINGWLYDESVTAVASADGFGYRMWPAGYGIVDFSAATPNNHMQAVTDFTSYTLFVTTNVKDEDVGDVMKYMDFFMTKERDELVYWGLPEWTTGEGADRRYTEEFKDLEAWLVYGAEGAKDGKYYGLAGSYMVPHADAGADVQYDLGPVSFFDGKYTYPEGPYFTIPQDLEKLMEKANTLNICNETISQKYIKPQMEWWLEDQTFKVGSYNAADPAFIAYDEKSSQYPESDTIKLLVNMVFAKPGDFEAAYKAYDDFNRSMGLYEAQESCAKTLSDAWQSAIMDNIIK